MQHQWSWLHPCTVPQFPQWEATQRKLCVGSCSGGAEFRDEWAAECEEPSPCSLHHFPIPNSPCNAAFTLPKPRQAAEQPKQPRNTLLLDDTRGAERGGGTCRAQHHRTPHGEGSGPRLTPVAWNLGSGRGRPRSHPRPHALTMSRLREIHVSSSSSSRAL